MTEHVSARPEPAPETAPASTPAESADLGAPLYVAWQVTNECNLACLHCIEESGPGKAFKDELDEEQVFGILGQFMDLEIPYLSFSGGEPMVHPLFFKMVEFVCSRGGQLKIETNGHFLTPENCVPIEINYSPTSFNVHEIGTAIDLAYELGAYSFYTGRTMYTGNAVKAWHKLELTDEQYAAFFATLHQKTEEYRGRMRVHFHEMGLLEELRYRLHHPAALLIVLPNGLVKLINALPFICGDLRRQSLTEIWANFQRAWQDPRVAQFIDDLSADPGKTSSLHQWVYV